MPVLNAVYTLALGLWLGGATLFTFVLTPKLFATLTRDMAGMIVGLLFPGYFRWGLACGTVALLCKLAGRGRFSLLCIGILAAMLLLTATQAFVIEPRAAAIKGQIVSFDTTAKDDPARMQFRKLHGLSMAANLAVIAGGVVLLVLASLPLAVPTNQIPSQNTVIPDRRP